MSGVASAQESRHTLRELGFVEPPTRPYRLVMLFDGAAATQAKLDEQNLTRELARSNVNLLVIPADQRKAYPEYDQLKRSADATRPAYWLIGPDRRAVEVDVMALRGELLRSTLRDELLEDVATSLGAVLLLESTDALANERAKMQAEAVLTQINKVRGQLDKAPEVGVRLRVLPVNKRPEERWALWSLGEELDAPGRPKLAVLFGNLRRAGPLLELNDLDQELFGRLAELGQYGEGGPDREYFEPPIPFAAPGRWHDQVAGTLPFSPTDAKMQAILQMEPARRTRPKLTYEALQAADPHRDEPDRIIHDPEPPLVVTDPVPIVATTPVTLTILLAGIAGWIILGMIVCLLERRARQQIIE